MCASDFARTPQNQVRQKPGRAHYDRDTIYSILDEALSCHVGFVHIGQPYAIPTIHGRDGDVLYFHGGRGSRLLAHMQTGQPVCITATLLDGIVLARSVFHHSMNYRSAMLFGVGAVVDSLAEKFHALEVITNHVVPDRWADARKPTEKELGATAVVRVNILNASAKIRTGPPVDDPEDWQLPVWAGVLPLGLHALSPEADPALAEGIPVPSYVSAYSRSSP
jgi:uncharacterized protein